MQKLIDRRVHDYYWQEEVSCAVTTLKILGELYNTQLHSQLLAATFGLNAGRCGSQCGLVEGTLLFIGVYGSDKEISKEKIKELCHSFCREFELYFGNLACKELRPQGFSPDNPPHLCEDFTKKAVGFSAKFICKNMNTLVGL